MLDSRKHASTIFRALRIDVTAAEERLTSELESEMARVKAELEAAAREERAIDEEAERADEDVAESEERLQGIRSEMDHLTQEIKQANLQSLSIAPADDLKVLLEGTKDSHTNTKINTIGSNNVVTGRQLVYFSQGPRKTLIFTAFCFFFSSRFSLLHRDNEKRAGCNSCTISLTS